jgi:hypothetical protein
VPPCPTAPAAASRSELVGSTLSLRLEDVNTLGQLTAQLRLRIPTLPSSEITTMYWDADFGVRLRSQFALEGVV